MSNTKYQMHVIPNTHWDREWTYDFQETRMLLVEFMDKLIDVLENNPEYDSYLMDSQVIPLEDYLEIRPEMEDRLKELVKNKRIWVGPWYTVPEDFIVNGESLVRNLVVGHQVSKAFGNTMKVGYTPFSYGQNSQMPQLYRGFDIDSIIFYRGIGRDECPAEFMLEGADGSQVFGSRFGSRARYNFYYVVWRQVMYGTKPHERIYDWESGGVPFHMCNGDSFTDSYYLTKPVMEFRENELKRCLDELKADDIKHFTTTHLAYMQGHDTSQPSEYEVEIVKKAKELVGEDNIFFSNLPAYLEAVKKEAKDLVLLKGERRNTDFQGPHTHLWNDGLSSRVNLKLKNVKIEHLLQRVTEPLTSISWLLGNDYPKAYLDTAWKYLLKSHPHDSINSSGVDQIEKDMNFYFDQAENISKSLIKRAFQKVLTQIDYSDCDASDIMVNVFNPCTYSRSEVVTAYIDIPDKLIRSYYDTEFRQSAIPFSLVDMDGNTIPIQYVTHFREEPVIRNLTDLALAMPCDRVKVYFKADDIPAMGYATYKVKFEHRFIGNKDNMVTGNNAMENEFLKVKINSDGTINITNKETGKTFENLHYFEDDGEVGMSWERRRPNMERIVKSSGCPVQISLDEKGPLKTTYRIVYNMMIPADTINTPLGMTRTDEMKPLTITTFVSLSKGEKAVDFKTKLTNNSKNHRIRVFLPTNLDVEYVNVETPFDVVERAIEREKDSLYGEVESVTYPMQRFADLSDGKDGIAFISSGLKEYEIIENEERAIAVTLLRAYSCSFCTVSGYWERHDEMEMTQCLGSYEFNYKVYPHSGTWDKSTVFEQAERLNIPMQIAQVGKCEGTLPSKLSFFEVTNPALVVSAFKKSEERDSIIIRLFNPTSGTEKGTIKTFNNVVKASLTNLNEEFISAIDVTNSNAVDITVGPKKIVTIELEFSK